MYPFSYTGLKIIHDQKIQEAMEQNRLHAGQETPKRGLLQTVGTFLAHFNNRREDPQTTMIGTNCAGENKGEAADCSLPTIAHDMDLCA